MQAPLNRCPRKAKWPQPLATRCPSRVIDGRDEIGKYRATGSLQHQQIRLLFVLYVGNDGDSSRPSVACLEQRAAVQTFYNGERRATTFEGGQVCRRDFVSVSKADIMDRRKDLNAHVKESGSRLIDHPA